MAPLKVFVAGLTNCHMLWLLSLAAKPRVCTDHDADAEAGILGNDTKSRFLLIRTLEPAAGDRAQRAAAKRGTIEVLHHEAHEACCIAKSVKRELICEPMFPI